MSVADESAGASDSIEKQEQRLRERCAREGWQVVAVLVDDGVSGGKTRAEAGRAVDMVRDGRADVLAVYKISRFGRRGLRDIVAVEDALEEREAQGKPARFVAELDGTDSATNPQWSLVAGIHASQAKAERAGVVAMMSDAKRRSRDNGRFVGGSPPFGFRSVPHVSGKGRSLEPYPPEVEIVHEIADRLLSGEGQTSIKRDLDARGIATTRSPARRAELLGVPAVDAETGEPLDRGVWSLAGIASVWAGVALLGQIAVSVPRRRSDGSIDRAASGRARKDWDVVRTEDGLPLVAFEPILDVATLERLRHVLRDPKRPASRRGAPKRRRARLLSGLAYCQCGQRMVVTTAGGVPIYKCIHVACTGVNIRADLAERAVDEWMMQGFGHLPEVERYERIIAPDVVAALRNVEAEIRDAQARLGDDGVDMLALVRTVETLKARRRELRDMPSEVVTESRYTGRTFGEAWEAMDMLGKRALLDDAADHVEIRATERKGFAQYQPERVIVRLKPDEYREPDDGGDSTGPHTPMPQRSE